MYPCPRRTVTAIARVLCVIACAWLVTGRARAEAELVVQWFAPEQCPDAAWATARIAQHLGRPLADVPAGPLHARVLITQEGTRYRLSVRTERGGSSGERSLEDARCEELAEAAALMIGLAIDAGALGEARPSDGPDGPSAAAVDNERPPGLEPAVPQPAPGTRPANRGLRVDTGLLVDLGFVPGPGLGPDLRLSVQNARAVAELGGYFLPAQSSRGDPSVSVSLWAVAARGCLHWGSSRWLAGVCAGLDLGRVSAEGRGLTENLRTRALFVALSTSVRGRLRIRGPLWLMLEAGPSVPLLRQRFVTLNTSTGRRSALHEPRVVSARGTLGLGLSF